MNAKYRIKGIIIVIYISTMLLFTACGAGGREVYEFTIYVPSLSSEHLSDSIKRKSEFNTGTTSVSEIYSPAKGQISPEELLIQEANTPSDYSELIKHLDNEEYEEAIEYINRLKLWSEKRHY